MKKQLAIVTGPTGVGKTEFVTQLADELPIEVINGDMGQMYTPLTIGTAKPDWRNAMVPHHLFDLLEQPLYFSAMKYREKVCSLIQEIWKRGKLPIIVGGSSFYLLSLFFSVSEQYDASIEKSDASADGLWQKLYSIDPERARTIDPQDTYRLQRAVAIWNATGKKPSHFKPHFNPLVPHVIMIWLDRERKDLYARINKRVETMMQEGWLAEATRLTNSEWKPFLQKKKIIGYDTLFEYADGALSFDEMYEEIQKKTRRYAKRQITFWRSFKRKLERAVASSGGAVHKSVRIHELHLTHRDIESYIKQLKNDVLL